MGGPKQVCSSMRTCKYDLRDKRCTKWVFYSITTLPYRVGISSRKRLGLVHWQAQLVDSTPFRVEHTGPWITMFPWSCQVFVRARFCTQMGAASCSKIVTRWDRERPKNGTVCMFLVLVLRPESLCLQQQTGGKTWNCPTFDRNLGFLLYFILQIEDAISASISRQRGTLFKFEFWKGAT